MATTTIPAGEGASSGGHYYDAYGSVEGIDVVKRGAGPLQHRAHDDAKTKSGPLSWGDGSAMDVAGGKFWFAVPLSVMRGGEPAYGSWIGSLSLDSGDASTYRVSPGKKKVSA